MIPVKKLIEEAQRSLSVGNVNAAAKLALRILRSNPEHYEAQLIQARCGALEGFHLTVSPASAQ
ncbi:MAG: hypothetical protein VX589_07005 [Myxococcota bacterium]|nr:hypothetical protein [Myxococcota bacterium]